MLRHVTFVITDVSEERIASIIKVTKICELEITVTVTNNRSALRENIISSQRASVAGYCYLCH
jgi:hypothetical protein